MLMIDCNSLHQFRLKEIRSPQVDSITATSKEASTGKKGYLLQSKHSLSITVDEIWVKLKCSHHMLRDSGGKESKAN